MLPIIKCTHSTVSVHFSCCYYFFVYSYVCSIFFSFVQLFKWIGSWTSSSLHMKCCLENLRYYFTAGKVFSLSVHFISRWSFSPLSWCRLILHITVCLRCFYLLLSLYFHLLLVIARLYYELTSVIIFNHWDQHKYKSDNSSRAEICLPSNWTNDIRIISSFDATKAQMKNIRTKCDKMLLNFTNDQWLCLLLIQWTDKMYVKVKLDGVPFHIELACLLPLYIVNFIAEIN